MTTSSDTQSIVKLWDPTNNAWNLVQNYSGHIARHPIWDAEYIGNDLIASGSASGQIKIWQASVYNKTIMNISTGSSVISLKLLSNGIYLACGLGNGNINIYNINNSGIVATLTGHTRAVNDLSLLSNDLLASSSGDTTVRIWNLTTYTNKFILVEHNVTAYGAYGLKQVSFDVLASASYDTSVKLWNITNGSLIRNLTGHTNYIQWGVDMLDSQTLLTGSYDQTIKSWNVNTGALLNTIQTGLIIDALAVVNFNNSLC